MGKDDADGKDFFWVKFDDGKEAAMPAKSLRRYIRYFKEDTSQEAIEEASTESDEVSSASGIPFANQREAPEASRVRQETESEDDRQDDEDDEGHRRKRSHETDSSSDGERKTLWNTAGDRRRWISAVSGRLAVHGKVWKLLS
jgi:hypothetical protein